MKKPVALLLALAMLSALAATASAAECDGHTYTSQFGGISQYIWDRKDGECHARKYLSIDVCTKCGATGARKYIEPTVCEYGMIQEKEYHVFSGNYRKERRAGTPFICFIRRVCSDCNGLFERVVRNCPRGSLHVTSPQSILQRIQSFISAHGCTGTTRRYRQGNLPHT